MNFFLIILAQSSFSFSRVKRVGCFGLVDFESFLFYYFEVLKFSIFLLVILWVFKKLCVKFHKGGEGVFDFFLMNFESFLFSYFEFSKSLIFFLSFWGSSKNIV